MLLQVPSRVFPCFARCFSSPVKRSLAWKGGSRRTTVLSGETSCALLWTPRRAVRHYTRTLPDPVVEEVRVVHHPPPVVQHYRVVHHFSDMWYRLRGHPCGPAVNWHLLHGNC